jgi:hypothetical protein
MTSGVNFLGLECRGCFGGNGHCGKYNIKAIYRRDDNNNNNNAALLPQWSISDTFRIVSYGCVDVNVNDWHIVTSIGSCFSSCLDRKLTRVIYDAIDGRCSCLSSLELTPQRCIDNVRFQLFVIDPTFQPFVH